MTPADSLPDDTEATFVERFGGIYEHSPWVAHRTWRPGLGKLNAAELAKRFAATVDGASRQQKLCLIRAHPDLAGRIAVAGQLTAQSTAEQSSAGLDRCTEVEFEAFQTLNLAYTAKFDFPFVMAVRDRHRTEILAAIEVRLTHEYAEEFTKAIQEIHTIARMRLANVDDEAGRR